MRTYSAKYYGYEKAKCLAETFIRYVQVGTSGFVLHGGWKNSFFGGEGCLLALDEAGFVLLLLLPEGLSAALACVGPLASRGGCSGGSEHDK